MIIRKNAEEINETPWRTVNGMEKFKRYYFVLENGERAFVMSHVNTDELIAIDTEGFSLAKNILKAKRYNALKTIEMAMNDNSIIEEVAY